MDRSGPRLPSPWWVLVPGVLLALAGARAVTAEMDRAQRDVDEAAERVATAVGGLAGESLAPLAEIRAPRDVADRTRHLYPVFLLRNDGGLYDTSPAPDLTEGAVERDAALRDDVLARCKEEPPAVAAALLAATAEAVETPWIEADLRLAITEADLASDSRADALAQIRSVLDMPPTWLGTHREAIRLRAERALELLVAATGPNATPEWVADVAEQVYFDAWQLPEHRRLALARQLLERVATRPADPDAQTVPPDDPVVGGIVRAEMAADSLRRRVFEIVSAPTGGDRDACALTFVTSGAAGQLVVMQRVTFERDQAWVCGIVPEERVRERLRAVQPRNGELAVQSPTGPLLGMPPVSAGAGDRETSVAVAGLPGWHVDLVVHFAAGVPTSALLLAAAVLVATLSLVAGAFALHRAARAQARLAEERRTFLDHVAHEVRTPAAALLALSEELQRGHVEPERQDEYHEHLARESQRLADLVDETLDLARLEGGRLVAQREPADLRDIVRDAVDAARPAEGRVLLTMPDAPVDVLVDRAAVRRAVRNLVDNALKHGAAPQAAEVTLAPDGALTVRDHGRGIPPGHIARVFERFHRVPSPTHEVKGVGLGLALVKEVAEVHGGRVAVENAPGGGARFTLRLPLSKGSPA